MGMIVLGAGNLILALLHLCGFSWMLKKSDRDKGRSYQRGAALGHFILGAGLVVMGILFPRADQQTGPAFWIAILSVALVSIAIAAINRLRFH